MKGRRVGRLGREAAELQDHCDFPPFDSADYEHAIMLLVNGGKIMHMVEVVYDFILEVL